MENSIDQLNLLSRNLNLLTGGHICSNDDHVLITGFGGLGIPLFHENAGIEFENSRKLTSSLTDLIKD